MPSSQVFRLTLKGIIRRPSRTFLTVLGLAVLVLVFVSVQSLVATLETNVTGSISSLGGEIDVWSRGASYPLLSKIPESTALVIQGIPGVARATPVALVLSALESDSGIVVAVPPADLAALFDYTMVRGSMINDNRSGVLALGFELSKTLGKGAGDQVSLNNALYQVSGVYRTNSWLDYSLILPLVVAQQVFGMEGGASMVIVTTQDPRNIGAVIDQIRTELPAMEAFRREEAPSRISPLLSSLESIASSMTLVVTVGAFLGVMNSNLNNLRERSRTFAIFKAVGASQGQIVKLVIYESLVLGVLGGLLGALISYVALRLISIPIGTGLSVSVVLEPSIFLYGLVIVTAASFIAALYPALKIGRVRPQEAFRFG